MRKTKIENNLYNKINKFIEIIRTIIYNIIGLLMVLLHFNFNPIGCVAYLIRVDIFAVKIWAPT